MKKVFKLQDLDCANCAAKMERGINEIDGVNEASVNFMSQKMIIDAEESSFDKIMKQVKKIIKKVEPGCAIVE